MFTFSLWAVLGTTLFYGACFHEASAGPAQRRKGYCILTGTSNPDSLEKACVQASDNPETPISRNYGIYLKL